MLSKIHTNLYKFKFELHLLKCNQNASGLPIVILDLHAFCITYCCFDFHLVSSSVSWSHYPWIIMFLIDTWVFFSRSKFWIFALNCSNCYHNSKALVSNFLAQDFVFCKCPNNSMTYFYIYISLTFNSTTYIWCSTSSSKPRLSMTFIRASSRLFESTTWFISMFSTVPNHVQYLLDIMGICIKKYIKGIGLH